MITEVMPAERLSPADTAVLKGAELLDEHGPENWREMIDIGTLSITSCERCVLGQVFGGYGIGREFLGISPSKAAQYGFATLGLDRGGGTRAWRRYLSGYAKG